MFLPSVTIFHPWSTETALFHLDPLNGIFIFFDEKQYNKQKTENKTKQKKPNKTKQKQKEKWKKEKEEGGKKGNNSSPLPLPK